MKKQTREKILHIFGVIFLLALNFKKYHNLLISSDLHNLIRKTKSLKFEVSFSSFKSFIDNNLSEFHQCSSLKNFASHS